jgi:hypothetical protein
MAQANSVPIAIRTPITDATSKTSTNGGRITGGDHETTLIPFWWEKRRGAEPEDLSGNPGEDLNRRWYERITGRTPVGWYIVALCYATAVILLGWWPWNILLILAVFPSKNHKPLHFGVFVTPEESVRSQVFCGRGGSL